jgi:TatD DNase family protein
MLQERKQLMLIDSHLHLNRDEFSGEVDDVLSRAQSAGVTGYLNVGYDLASSEASVVLAHQHQNIFASVGVHPHDALQVADASGQITQSGQCTLEKLTAMAADHCVIAWGEIGLDYFRDLSPRPAQHASFVAQIHAADTAGLPVILHIRDAYQEALEVLETEGLPARRGVMHAFAGNVDVARWGVERGFLLGIGGPLTYKNSQLPDVVAAVSLDDIILETDAPWLPPVPHRGKRNEPSYVALTAAKVAEIHDVSVDEVASRTTSNACRLFGEGNWA